MTESSRLHRTGRATRGPCPRLLATAVCLAVAGVAPDVRAATFTVRNNCSYTVYPGIFPASLFSNGGWSLGAGASSTFTVASGSIGRLWGRTGCNTASPAVCTSGQCGGTGLQCAGTTGVPDTALFEWNINAAGTDWYDVSYVDGIDNPIGVTVSNGSCVSPSTCNPAVITSCPAILRSGNVCLSPCTAFNTDQLCCRGAFGAPATCVVAAWPAADQAYVSNVHANCPNSYAYAYDDTLGLHTCPTGSNYTITFCPSGAASGGTTPPPPLPPPPPGGTVLAAHADSSTGVTFTATHVLWSDLHYTIAGRGQLNVRMPQTGSTASLSVARPANAAITYFFTYWSVGAAGAVDSPVATIQ